MKHKYGEYYDALGDLRLLEGVVTGIKNEGNNFVSFSECMKRMADRLHPGMKLKFRTTEDGYIRFFRTR